MYLPTESPWRGVYRFTRAVLQNPNYTLLNVDDAVCRLKADWLTRRGEGEEATVELIGNEYWRCKQWLQWALSLF